MTAFASKIDLFLFISPLSLSVSARVQTLHPVTPRKRPPCRRKSPAAQRLGRRTRSTRGTSEGRLPFTWPPSGEMPSKLKSSLVWELTSMSKTLQVHEMISEATFRRDITLLFEKTPCLKSYRCCPLQVGPRFMKPVI